MDHAAKLALLWRVKSASHADLVKSAHFTELLCFTYPLISCSCSLICILKVHALQSRVNGQLLLDPSSDEAYFEDGSCLLAVMSSSKAVSGLQTSKASFIS